MKIRRVIVGLHSVPRDRAVVEAAARLAGRLEAELVGLFVENIDLLRFAELPFAQELGVTSATRRGLNARGMERSMRALATEMERMLASAAGRVPVRWSFRIARGSVAPEMLATATEADLLVADFDPPPDLAAQVPVRVVRAGDAAALHGALASDDGILILTGSSDAAVRDALLRLMTHAEEPGAGPG